MTPSVRLIAATAPVLPEAGANAADLVAYVARVSNPANQGNHETGPKLIASLIRRKEWSPLEMADATLEITTTRDISRQMLRHGKGFSFQEFSQRYAEVTAFSEPREARRKDPNNRQKSIELGDSVEDQALRDWWRAQQLIVISRARSLYSEALERGLAKEVARVILPEGLTMSPLYMKGPFRSWIHYNGLRTESETQKEHRLIAEQCREVLAGQWPGIFGASP